MIVQQYDMLRLRPMFEISSVLHLLFTVLFTLQRRYLPTISIHSNQIWVMVIICFWGRYGLGNMEGHHLAEHPVLIQKNSCCISFI